MAISTRVNDDDVTAFIDAVADPVRRADALDLRALLHEVTGDPGRMWGTSIVGFGSSSYTNSSGTHDWFVLGFSPRKAASTLYGVYNDYAPADPLLDAIGPHTTGKGCLYLKRLDGIDRAALRTLLQSAWSGHGG